MVDYMDSYRQISIFVLANEKEWTLLGCMLGPLVLLDCFVVEPNEWGMINDCR
jgi:hypothetical protein